MAANSLTFSLLGKDVSASKTIDGVSKSAEKAGGVFKSMATIAGGALAALGITAGLGAVKDYLGESVTAYKEAELAQLQLSDAYSKFPAVSSVSIDSLRELNNELMNKTRFDDDALASGQAMLAQFNLTGEQIRDLTPLMADYAARTGKDIPGAAEDLGKAMLGQGRALKSIGLDFKDAGSTGANFEQVMAGLSSQVGGFAEKDGAAGAGMAERLSNQFGELQETIGGGLLPVITTLQSAFLQHVMPILQTVASTVSSSIGPAFEGLIGIVGPIAQQLGALLGPILSTLGPQVLDLAMAFSPLGMILTALTPVLPILAGLLQQVASILSDALASALPIITDLMSGLASILSGVLASILPIIAEWMTVLGGVIQQIMPVVMQLASSIGGALMTVLEALAPILPVLMKAVMSLLTALLPLIDPILQIVQAFLPLLPILAELVATLLPPLLDLFMAVLQPILSLITPLVELLAPALKWVAEAISVLVSWIADMLMPIVQALIPVLTGIAGTLKDALGGLASFVGDVFRNVANFVAGGINMIIDMVNGAVDIINEMGHAASDLTGGAVSWKIGKLPKIPALAEGGIVSAATLAVIGEGSEPEVVAPLSKLPQIAAGYANGGSSERPIYADGIGLIGWLRQVAGEEARLVFATGEGRNLLTSKMGSQRT